ncbi:MAG: Gfo/Idh/MocA family oxidoreductase [Alphaproteobacteria bacterium]|nr:Gfo/Idh/MocA family oxidoreductase [Alphaproteobacteria bacterium]
MSDGRIGLGLIGAGDVVQRFYLPTLVGHPRLRVAAIASPGGRSARALADRHAIPSVCDTAEALIARPDVNAVAVCTPPDSHRAIGSAALAAGKHVLMEKPIAPDYADCAALLGAARSGGAILYYAYNNRLRDENQALTARVLSGAVGPLEALDVEWLRTKGMLDPLWWRDPARAGGGVLADLGSHVIMIALGLVPARSRFSARAALLRRSGNDADPEDVAVAHVVIDDAIPLSLRAGWGMALNQPAIVNLRAFGRRGMATNRDHDGPARDGYADLLDRFAAHIDARRQPDLGIVDDCARLLQALYDVGRSGGVVEGTFRGGGWA